jgi:hypothetical protein
MLLLCMHHALLAFVSHQSGRLLVSHIAVCNSLSLNNSLVAALNRSETSADHGNACWHSIHSNEVKMHA